MTLISDGNSEIIYRNKFEAKLLPDNIIYFKYYAGQLIDLHEIRDSFAIHDILGVDASVRRIIHSESLGSITKEGRECVQNESRPASAEAFVIDSLPQKIIFNIFLKMRTTEHSIKAFTKLEDAIEWIKRD